MMENKTVFKAKPFAQRLGTARVLFLRGLSQAQGRSYAKLIGSDRPAFFPWDPTGLAYHLRTHVLHQSTAAAPANQRTHVRLRPQENRLRHVFSGSRNLPWRKAGLRFLTLW